MKNRREKRKFKRRPNCKSARLTVKCVLQSDHASLETLAPSDSTTVHANPRTAALTVHVNPQTVALLRVLSELVPWRRIPTTVQVDKLSEPSQARMIASSAVVSVAYTGKFTTTAKGAEGMQVIAGSSQEQKMNSTPHMVKLYKKRLCE